MYWIHFQNVHFFTYQKTLLHTIFWLFLKPLKAFSVFLSRSFNFYSSKYKNFIVTDDFNAEKTNNYLKKFCTSCNLRKLIKQSTCFKSLENPVRIDHIHRYSFIKYLWGRFVWLHKLTLTVLKVFHVKHKPKFIQYRDFNHLDNASFRADLLQELSLQNFQSGEFENLKYFSSKVLNIHVPINIHFFIS